VAALCDDTLKLIGANCRHQFRSGSVERFRKANRIRQARESTRATSCDKSQAVCLANPRRQAPARRNRRRDRRCAVPKILKRAKRRSAITIHSDDFPHPEQCRPAPRRERMQLFGKRREKSRLFRDHSSTPLLVRTPIARYPSRFTSYCQAGPSGSFSPREAEHRLKEPGLRPHRGNLGLFSISRYHFDEELHRTSRSDNHGVISRRALPVSRRSWQRSFILSA
jgi:hypothetical protein